MPFSLVYDSRPKENNARPAVAVFPYRAYDPWLYLRLRKTAHVPGEYSSSIVVGTAVVSQQPAEIFYCCASSLLCTAVPVTGRSVTDVSYIHTSYYCCTFGLQNIHTECIPSIVAGVLCTSQDSKAHGELHASLQRHLRGHVFIWAVLTSRTCCAATC